MKILTIGHLARETGTKVETIRFYEKSGLLPAPSRTDGNYRSYDEARILPPGPERDAKYQRMQEIVTDQCVWIFRVRRVLYSLMYNWLHGYKYNDLSTKYFKYCRIDEEAREAALQKLGKPNPWPLVWASLVLFVLVATTFWAARNTRRAW